nr:response regulator [Methylomarinum sp. Ch1-1]MDP4519375.1 response regulator [Methylomarinum sp. Ch1-1]
MTIRVLIVDDSRFICKRIQQILEEDQEYTVVGVAGNGREAVKLAAQLKPDVITMDVEMPLMDGITAVKKIMSDCPAPILMFSASTQVGAKATLDALNAGAIDFLPKQLDDIDGNREMAKRLLRRRVRVVAQQASKIRRQVSQAQVKQAAAPVQRMAGGRKPRRDLLLIAASTGGRWRYKKFWLGYRRAVPFPFY